MNQLRPFAVMLLTAALVTACGDQQVPTDVPRQQSQNDQTPGTFASAVTSGGRQHTGRSSLGPSFSVSSSSSAGNLAPVVQVVGKVSLSIDGVGTNAASGVVEVEKKAGTTVRGAYLAAALMCCTGYRIANGDIKIDGQGVTFTQSAPAFPGQGHASENYWADVTALVKAKIDGSAPGRVGFSITEASTFDVDGVILAVIFDDPSQAQDNTVTLLFGGLSSTGDNFVVTTADPLNPADPNLVVDMSLGIGFGFQPSGQYSIVDVNGQRLTSSAGGQDDGASSNGALITVGGLDDSNANPNPFVNDGAGPRTDDELYDLKPFIAAGSNTILVNTLNPSNDDNVFFAAFFMTVKAHVENPEVPTNSPPVANAGADATAECTGNGATVTLDGSASSDSDGSIVKYEWFEGSTKLGEGATLSASLGMGAHVIRLVVTDNEGATAEDEVTVTVVDTQAPSLTLSATPGNIWPPNHKYVAVTVSAAAADGCDSHVSLSGSVVSNEADEADGTGDGETTGDIRVVRADGTVLLSSNASPSVAFNPAAGDRLEVRAERYGTAAPRIYTITLTATDAGGNTTTRTATVTIAHDQGR